MIKIKSFSTRLSLNIVMFTSLLFIIAIGMVALSSHRLIAEEAETSSKNLLNSTMLQIEKTLKAVEIVVETSSWNIQDILDNPEKLTEYTRSIIEKSEVIQGYGIAFTKNHFQGKKFFCPYSYKKDGQVFTKYITGPEYDYFLSDWYLLPSLLKKPVWTEPYHGNAGLDISISTYCFPIRDEDGNVIAVINADIPLSWIADITKNIQPYPNSQVMMYGATGSYISLGVNADFAGETIFSMAMQSDDIKDPLEFSRKITDNDNGIVKFKLGNDINFMVFGTMTNGWKASITCNYKEVLKRSSQMNFILTLIALAGLLILFFICYSTIRRITKPLMEFSESAESIANGNFNTALPEIKSNDEIKVLHDSFDNMQKSLTSYIHELKETTAVNERIQSELNIASDIQMSMLPKNFPDKKVVDMHAILKPAREVGGDLYDFFIEGDYLFFTVGDVSGKGVPAAMFMTETRTSFHFTASPDIPFRDIMSLMNRVVCDGNDSNMFVTVFAGRLNMKNGELEFCNAGHNPIVIVTPDGKSSFLAVKPNLAIGLYQDFQYESQKIILEKGSTLLLYTDGVTEAERADKRQYGDARLLEWASGIRQHEDSRQSCEALFEDVKRFTEGNEQNDDITIMAIKI